MADLLYKYRSLEPWQYLLDIFVNKRLYAASFQDLNDPMEGMFTYSKNDVSQGFIKQIVEEKSRIHICSLSRICNSTVMWSYYSAGHKGIVLGVAIVPYNNEQFDVKNVTYTQRISFKAYRGSNAEIDAKGILSKKLSGWKHEREVRVLTRKNYVPASVKSVILGYKMQENQRQLITNLLARIDPEICVSTMNRDDLDSSVVS